MLLYNRQETGNLSSGVYEQTAPVLIAVESSFPRLRSCFEIRSSGSRIALVTATRARSALDAALRSRPARLSARRVRERELPFRLRPSRVAPCCQHREPFRFRSQGPAIGADIRPSPGHRAVRLRGRGHRPGPRFGPSLRHPRGQQLPLVPPTRDTRSRTRISSPGCPSRYAM